MPLAYPPEKNAIHPRRYDLDWVRVLAFGLLILYHVGMFYVADWDWHIKSANPSEWLQNLMYLTNPWRMSLLFLVSGMAMRFACESLRASQLVAIRNRRLLLPLVFAMAFIVSPQVYVELKVKEGLSQDYLSFMATYLNMGTDAFPDHQHGPLGLWTWNHLWFLAYLWVYTLVFAMLKPRLDRLAQRWEVAALPGWALIVLPVAMLLVYRLTLLQAFPPDHSLTSDWYNHARYLSFFFGGYLLAKSTAFWSFTRRHVWNLLAAAMSCYVGILLYINEALPGQALVAEPLLTFLIRILVSFDQWLWIVALLGLAQRYLNRDSRVLSYMNEAILPWYILHQSLTVVIAYGLSELMLPQLIEAALLIAGTVVGCALGYELIRRVRLMRLLFGLKPAPRAREGRRLPSAGVGVSGKGLVEGG